MNKPLQLYINIPFRPVGCDSCPGGTQPYDQTVMKAYAIALAAEIKAAAPSMDDYTVTSVRLGGCAAPVITTRVLRDIMSQVRESFRIAPDAEFSLETLPANMIERLCVGMNYDHLSRMCCHLGTVHNNEWTALGLPYEYAVSQTNIDTAMKTYRPNALTLTVYYGIPGQTETSLNTTLNRVLAWGCDSVRLLPGKNQSEPLYAFAANRLTEAGYRRVSLREFSLPGREDRFTADTSAGIDRLGLGLGARAEYDGAAYHNTSDMNVYLDNSADLSVIARDIVPVDDAAQASRSAMLALTMPDGVAANAVPESMKPLLDRLFAAGCAAEINSSVILTDKGIVHWDTKLMRYA